MIAPTCVPTGLRATQPFTTRQRWLATSVSQRLLVFSSWGADAFGGAGGRTQFADYNFNT